MTSQTIINAIAAELVGRGAYARLDCGNQGALGQHIGCAFDIWVSDTHPSAELQEAVQRALIALEFSW